MDFYLTNIIIMSGVKVTTGVDTWSRGRRDRRSSRPQNFPGEGHVLGAQNNTSSEDSADFKSASEGLSEPSSESNDVYYDALENKEVIKTSHNLFVAINHYLLGDLNDVFPTPGDFFNWLKSVNMMRKDPNFGGLFAQQDPSYSVENEDMHGDSKHFTMNTEILKRKLEMSVIFNSALFVTWAKGVYMAFSKSGIYDKNLIELFNKLSTTGIEGIAPDFIKENLHYLLLIYVMFKLVQLFGEQPLKYAIELTNREKKINGLNFFLTLIIKCLYYTQTKGVQVGAKIIDVIGSSLTWYVMMQLYVLSLIYVFIFKKIPFIGNPINFINNIISSFKAEEVQGKNIPTVELDTLDPKLGYSESLWNSIKRIFTLPEGNRPDGMGNRVDGSYPSDNPETGPVRVHHPLGLKPNDVAGTIGETNKMMMRSGNTYFTGNARPGIHSLYDNLGLRPGNPLKKAFSGGGGNGEEDIKRIKDELQEKLKEELKSLPEPKFETKGQTSVMVNQGEINAHVNLINHYINNLFTIELEKLDKEELQYLAKGPGPGPDNNQNEMKMLNPDKEGLRKSGRLNLSGNQHELRELPRDRRAEINHWKSMQDKYDEMNVNFQSAEEGLSEGVRSRGGGNRRSKKSNRRSKRSNRRSKRSNRRSKKSNRRSKKSNRRSKRSNRRSRSKRKTR